MKKITDCDLEVTVRLNKKGLSVEYAESAGVTSALVPYSLLVVGIVNDVKQEGLVRHQYFAEMPARFMLFKDTKDAVVFFSAMQECILDGECCDYMNHKPYKLNLIGIRLNN